MKNKIKAGLIETIKWIGYPTSIIMGLVIIFMLDLYIFQFIYYVPPSLLLLGIIGFTIGYRGYKDE